MAELWQTRLDSAFGVFELRRWPESRDGSLRAWDAADELLLMHLAGMPDDRLSSSRRVLLLNDSHGALATVLHHLSPTSWSDSCQTHRAAQRNRDINGLSAAVKWLDSLTEPTGIQDIVLIRIPGTLALLEDQLARLRPHVDEHTVIVAGAMLRHLPSAVFSLFEDYIGQVTTSLAKKKARLLFIHPDANRPVRASPYPDSFRDPDTGLELLNHANVFSRTRLDNGARFLMARFDTLSPVRDVVDLGCGNGVLGIRLQQCHPDARVEYIDESHMAVASARENHRRLLGDDREALFTVADGLEACAPGSQDRVLCNPPFHQQHVIGNAIAHNMFEGSHRCLRRGGELLVVANRHLPHANALKHRFGHCRMLDQNRQFVILRALKR